jgi:hypothetical protein
MVAVLASVDGVDERLRSCSARTPQSLSRIIARTALTIALLLE